MDVRYGEHHDRKLKGGLEAHFIRHPGSSKWHIRSFDLTWGSLIQGFVQTKNWFAEKLGWDKLEFDTTDEACLFIEKHVRLISGRPATQS
jgi:hypothetical protein